MSINYKKRFITIGAISALSFIAALVAFLLIHLRIVTGEHSISVALVGLFASITLSFMGLLSILLLAWGRYVERNFGKFKNL